MITTSPMDLPPTQEEINQSSKTLSNLSDGFSNLKVIEYLTIQRTNYVAQIAIKDDDLFFHLYGKLPSNLDDIFQFVFKNVVVDLTNYTEEQHAKLVAAGTKNLPANFLVDIYLQLKNHPAQIQKFYEKTFQSYTYRIKEGDTLYVDVLAKKIIDLIDLTFESQQ